MIKIPEEKLKQPTTERWTNNLGTVFDPINLSIGFGQATLPSRLELRLDGVLP